MTLRLTVYGTVLGFVLGAALASMRLSSSPFLQVVAWGYIWAFRSIPLIVQLLFWFNIAYLYQELSLGIPFGPEFVHFTTNNLFGPLGAAVLGLALHQAAYAAEIIRGGIISVDAGQVEAADWAVRGYYTPYATPQKVEVSTARDDLRQHVTAVGTVHVALGGSAYELVAW